MNSNRIFTKILTLFVAVSFFTQTISPSFSFSQELLLPKPDQFISLSENYSFPLLKGLKFSPQEPLKMEFIIDRGDDKVATQEEAAQLIRYFLAGLTIPEEDLWVNLSPYEEDRIIPEKLAETDLGKDLLSQDYLLKQLSSSLTYPESETGKDYWKEVYQEVYKIAKTTKVPVNTFNKIWIIPDEAEVAESENFALVTKATLKAMLEEDYLALKNKLPEIQSQKKDLQEVTIERINKVASQVMRQQILPQINADVNQGRNFANLRQIYHSLILGVWFKKRFKESIYQHYIGKNKIQGIDIDDKSVKEKIYNLYVQAFKKGLYNYIRTEQEPITRKRIKRQYFSGGLDKRRLGDEVVFVNLSPHQLLEEGETLPDRSVSSAIVGINHFPSEEKIAASPLTAISIPGIGEISTIEEIDFKGKRVVIRVDFNVPIEYDAQGKLKVADPHKIEEALETIRYIQAQNPKYTVLITHFEPKKEGIISTEVIFNELKKLLPREKIIFSRESVIEEGLKEEVIKTISQYKEGEIILLENIRFAKGEKKGCPKLIEQLSSLADIYVVDAFATIHRPHASMLPSTEIKAVGFLVEKEISNLSQGLSPDVAIFGGLKVEDKVAMVESLLEKMQKGGRILIGGAMAYTFLKAKDPEIKLGKSLIEEDKIELAKEILGRAKAKGIEIVLPVDHLVATELSEGAEATTTKSINIPEGKMGVDIGEKTISFFLEKLEGAEIIVWNGPMGAFEKRFGGFINGTKKLLEGINSLKSTKKVIIGGGDINKAVKDVIKKTATTLDENKFFLSTGGGATLGFLAMEESVGKVLRNLTVSSPVSVTDRIDKEEKKYVYYIGGNTNKYTVGGKGAGLSMMYNEGLPVPPAFTIPTWLCPEYLKENKLPEPLIQAIEENLKRLENEMGRKFGDEQNPLLVSVRSGAAVSMPGMMDTILNIGLNDRNVDNFGQNTDPRTAWDSYRRLIQMFGDVVLGIEKTHFEKILNEVKKENNYTSDTQLKVEDLKNLVEKYKRLIKEELAKREDSKIKEFPQDPKTQLFMAIEAVFKSWNNPRAVDYRRIFKVPANIIGTAVTIQAMVFGNMGENSGTGVLFTRDPGTGENKPVGDFLRTAQGEDVVAGIRTPQSIEEMKDTLPEVYEELLRVIPFLEKLYKNMVDIEFTVENGKLWLLQVRSGKRTGIAAFKIAFELFEEWKEELEKQELSQEKFSQEITELEKRVLELIDPYQHIGHLLFPIFDPQALKKAEEEGRLLTKAIAAGPGAGSGKVVFDKRKAIEEAGKGNKVILVREMTTPDDVGAMAVSQGILTSTGGQLCHAAVVARQMGKPSVVGASEIIIDEENKLFRVGDIEIKEGDQMVNFYKEQMSMYGWRLLNVVEYGKCILNFEKEDESCIIKLEPSGSKLDITISVVPRPLPTERKTERGTKSSVK